MAIQSIVGVSGAIGNIVYVQRNGRTIIRTVPDTVRQTPNTRKRSTNFGIASKTASTIRKLLNPAIPFPKDLRMQNLLRGALAKWLSITQVHDLVPSGNIPYLTGFDFNEKTSVAERWKVKFSVTKVADNILRLSIPAFLPKLSISAPVHTTRIECVVAACSCKLAGETGRGSFINTFSFPNNNEIMWGRDIEIPLSTSTGNLIAVAVSLKYLENKKEGEVLITNPVFMPASVVGAIYC